MLFESILENCGMLNEDTKKFSILSDNLQNKISQYIDDMELDDDEFMELPSTYYDRNPYGVEDRLAGGSGGWFNDNEDEIFNAKAQKFIDYIEDDGILNYIEVTNDDLLGDYTVDDLDDLGSDADELLLKEIKEAFGV